MFSYCLYTGVPPDFKTNKNSLLSTVVTMLNFETILFPDWVRVWWRAVLTKKVLLVFQGNRTLSTRAGLMLRLANTEAATCYLYHACLCYRWRPKDAANTWFALTRSTAPQTSTVSCLLAPSLLFTGEHVFLTLTARFTDSRSRTMERTILGIQS